MLSLLTLYFGVWLTRVEAPAAFSDLFDDLGGRKDVQERRLV